jgi:phage terminase large subunit-like protein
MVNHRTQWTTSSAEKLLTKWCSNIPTVARYTLDILTGNIPSGRPVFLAVERFLHDLEEGSARGLKFDQAAAARPIRFFRDCAPFQLAPFQQFCVANTHGWMGTDGFRRFRVAYLEIGKGNGKSPMVGGLGLYALGADNEPEAEVYFAATMKDQAKISFRDAEIIYDGSAALRKRIQKHRDNLSIPAKHSFCRPISSEKRGLDGKRPHFVGIDEVHEHPNSTVVDKMRAGTKGRRQALVFLITNSGHDRESVCFYYHEYSIKILERVLENDSHFAYVCTLDACDECYRNGHLQPNADCPDCDSWLDEDTWIKANPGLGTILQKKYLREQVTEAVAMPTKENIVRRLNFCMWTQADVRAIGAQAWASCAGTDAKDPVAWRERQMQELRGLEADAGIDLGSTDDMSAQVLLFHKQAKLEKARILPFFYCPRDGVALRTQKDRIPYEMWERQGFLKVTPGNVRDDEFIRKDLNDCSRLFHIRGIRYDPYRALLLVNQLLADGLKLVEHRQGFISMSDPVDRLLSMVRSAEFEHGNNPVLNWMADNLVVTQDAAGNKKPIKPSNPNSPKKIDGMVALIMAIAEMDSHPASVRPRISRL